MSMGRPVVVTVAAIAGYFDPPSGWRSHAEALPADVEWAGDGAPVVMLARGDSATGAGMTGSPPQAMCMYQTDA